MPSVRYGCGPRRNSVCRPSTRSANGSRFMPSQVEARPVAILSRASCGSAQRSLTQDASTGEFYFASLSDYDRQLFTIQKAHFSSMIPWSRSPRVESLVASSQEIVDVATELWSVVAVAVDDFNRAVYWTQKHIDNIDDRDGIWCASLDGGGATKVLHDMTMVGGASPRRPCTGVAM